MKRFRILFIILSLSTSSLVRSDIVLDQHHTFTSSIANSTNGDVSQMGQTFTVGVAGTLDHIDVLMFRLGGIFDPTGFTIGTGDNSESQCSTERRCHGHL